MNAPTRGLVRLLELVNRNGAWSVDDQHDESTNHACRLEEIVFFKIPHQRVHLVRPKIMKRDVESDEPKHHHHRSQLRLATDGDQSNQTEADNAHADLR